MRHIETKITMMFLLLSIACGESESLKSLTQYSIIVPPRTITVEITNYCPQNIDNRLFTISEMFATNRSTRITNNQYLTDFDADGLIDRFELLTTNVNLYNISYYLDDTNEDGYSDFIMHLLGFEADRQPTLPLCRLILNDLDKDGLTDCEEGLLRLDPANFDSDNDMIPDKDELLIGTNPLDQYDSNQDFDNDGLTNIQEWLIGLPIDETNTPETTKLAYNYSLEINMEQSLQCYHLTVKNVPILDIAKGNRVEFFVFEADQLDRKIMRTMRLIIPRNFSNDIIQLETITDGKVLVFERSGEYVVEDRP